MRALELNDTGLDLRQHPKARWRLLSALASLVRRWPRSGRVVVLRQEVRLPGLPPAFDGYRILHLSDLHVDDGLRADGLLAALAGCEADLAAFTGDFTIGYGRSEEAAVAYVGRLLAALRPRCPLILGVRGNSDRPELMPRLARAGLTVLDNRSLPVSRGGETIWVAGVDDPHHEADDLGRALEGVPERAFKVLLAHSPDVLLRLGGRQVGLILAGHTHGGQVRLPVIGPLVTKTRLPRRFSRGLIRGDGFCCHVSPGLGGIPLRFRCPPEVAWLTLRSPACGGPPPC